jgi:hypothetical protein
MNWGAPEKKFDTREIRDEWIKDKRCLFNFTQHGFSKESKKSDRFHEPIHWQHDVSNCGANSPHN